MNQSASNGDLRLPTRRLLLVQSSASFDGSTVSGHLIAEGLLGRGWRVDVAFAGQGPFRARYEALGVATHQVEHGRWLAHASLARYLRKDVFPERRAVSRFRRLLRELPPDLVYVNSLLGMAAAWAARSLRIPVVWHIRELFDDVGGEMHDPPLAGRRLVRWVIRRCATRVVVISRAVADNVLGDRGRLEATIVPNAVRDEFFQRGGPPNECRARLGLPCDGHLVGLPGTLRPMKGHEFFIRAARKLAAASPACRFAVTGDGSPAYRAGLEQLVKDGGLSDRFHFVGTVEDMRNFFGACDVAVVPSRAEPFGRVVIEAFAAGVPVVGSAVGGIRETVRHEQTGLLVPYGDDEQLAQAILRLLGDVRLRERLVAEARRQAEAEYRQDVYQDTIAAIAEEALGTLRPALLPQAGGT